MSNSFSIQDKSSLLYASPSPSGRVGEGLLLTAQLTLDLRNFYPRDIPYLRKGIANLVGLDNDVFHNHQKSGEVQYRPSKIHYRSEDGKAVLFGFAKGATALLDLARDRQGEPLQLGRRIETFRVAHLEYKQQELEIQETRNYTIFDWLPLSEQNYAQWASLSRLADRTIFLERILYANVIAFCKSIAWQLPPDTLRVELLDCFDQQQTRFKDTTLLKFAIRFRTNITLPDSIALGRKGTFGFGVVRRG